jgi:hypothetical protein
MPKHTLVGSYAEFVASFDSAARGFERQGVRVEKTPIDAPHLVAWCGRWGLRIDTAGRSRYGAALLAAGGDLAELDRGGFVDRTRRGH